ncbi:hypothetical protein PVAP13_9NG229200 [Panicum virgatum]|uniref:Uncharacterized protein n=1 Tax=Panicum virgatum TaxID=38727 RepID=A0A8T0ML96_PANVG|nr:hypothetical protein PVAP13_9NG229200 [Panicum virgatum]
MSKPRALEDLMMAVDAGRVDLPTVGSEKQQLLAPRRPSYGRGWKGAPPPVVVAAAEASADTSFEFSAVVSYSSSSPASMVFSDGQLRAHQFPAVRSAGGGGSSRAASPVRRSASAAKAAAGGVTGSKKRVSLAADGAASKAAAAAGRQGNKKSGGLLGCMGSACGSARSEVVEPARNTNRKVVAV